MIFVEINIAYAVRIFPVF